MAEKQRMKQKQAAHKAAVQRSESAKRAKKAAPDIPKPQLGYAGNGLAASVSLESLMASRGLRLQPKLRVTAANDRYEQEADAVASQVVERLQGAKASDASKQPKGMQRQQEEEEPLQAKRATPTPIGRDGGELDASTEQALEAARGGGQRMPSDVREPMEQAFGADFGSVRLHTGGQAHHLNRAISAKAFTTGSDIFFRQGAYEPHNRSGQELLAHELAHVVQQGNAPARAYDVQRDDDEESRPAPGPWRVGRPRSGARIAAGPGSKRPGGNSKSVEGSKHSSRVFQLQELSYKGLALFMRQILGLSDPTAVASLGVDFTFSIGINGGVNNILGATIAPYITLGASLKVSDLRSLIVEGRLEFGAKSDIDLAKLWKIHGKIGMQLALNGTFEDEKHFAAFLIAQVTALLKGFKRVVFACARKRKKQLTPQEIAGIQQLGLPQDVEGYEELSQKGASSTAVSVGLTSEVGTDIAGAVGATVTATGTHTTYYKKNAKNQPVRKVGTSRVFTFKLSLGLPGTPIKCDITTTRTIRENVGNTDSLNIKVAPSIPIGGPILQQIVQNAPTVLAGSSFEDGAMRFIKALFDPVNLAVLAGGIGASSPALEFNLVSRVPAKQGKMFIKQLRDGDYILQYARLSKNFEKKFEFAQDIPTSVPGLNVALGQTLALKRSVGTAEFLGSRTLGYIQIVYNGLMNRGRRGQRQWSQYRDQHKHEIYKMFIAVADPKSAASAEARKLDTSAVTNELQPDIISKANAFVSMCDARFSPDKMKAFDLQKESDVQRLRTMQALVLPYFEAYLEAARLAGQKADAQTWRRTSSGTVRAAVDGNNGPAKPQLLQVKYDKKNKDEANDRFPQTLRESYEEGFRHRIAFTGYNSGKARQVEVKVDFQKPDQATEKFVKQIYSRGLHKYNQFPLGLVMLDDGFKRHALDTQKQYRTIYDNRKATNINEKKARAEALKEQQLFWEKNLQKHLTTLMDQTLDTQLERKN